MRTILVIDDSATSRLLLKAYVSGDENIQAVEASCLDEALTVAAEFHPDFIFMDYNMPDYNGIEMAQALRAQGIDAHFVLLTANVLPSIVDDAKQAGFFEVIDKPVNREKIMQVLEGIG